MYLLKCVVNVSVCVMLLFIAVMESVLSLLNFESLMNTLKDQVGL
jgi:hypothetical protein